MDGSVVAAAAAALKGSPLRAQITTELPHPLQVGRGVVVPLAGWAYHPELALQELTVVVGDERHQARLGGLPIPDVLVREGEHFDPKGMSLDSGFVALVPFESVDGRRRVGLALEALTEEGALRAELGDLVLESGPPLSPLPALSDASGPEVAICMGTYNPQFELFERQVASIRAQTYENWTCIVSDDASDPATSRRVEALLSGDTRFRLLRHQKRVGFYRNFERALLEVPANTPFVALADHDDYWQPKKLATLLEAFDDRTVLAYSDMRIVGADGRVLAKTHWTTRRNNKRNLAALLSANTVSGAGSIFRRELLAYILPFPPPIGEAYHDHWIACTALTLGNLSYIDRPLYDYIQHNRNVIGHFAPARRSLVRGLAEAVGAVVHLDRPAFGGVSPATLYTNDVVRVESIAATVCLRAGNVASRQKRQVLERFARLDQSLGAAIWLALRGIPGCRRRSVTLGAEYRLLRGVRWRRRHTRSVH
jgi:glycosyltransferase involved in cell wall biosynthesis